MHFEYSTTPSLLCTIKFCVKQLSADAPCINLQERERRTNIPQEINDFGLFLLEDHNGVRIRSKALKHMNFATEINQYKKCGKGKHPVTWKTQTEVLPDIELSTLAEEIEAIKNEQRIYTLC